MHRNPLLIALALLGTAACRAPVPASDPFERTGELVAFSGGSAGAAAACSTCHGLEGQGDGHLVPRIAGLDAGYAVRQLENFASGARRNAQMEWIARQLDLTARQKVSRYYAQVPTGRRAIQATSVDCGAGELYHRGAAPGLPSCASCHGADGAGDAGNPPLARQPAPYLAAQLEAWANGKRYGDPDGTMTAISRSLSPRDRQALAEYAAALPGDGGDRSVPATCLRTRRPG